MKHKTRIMNYSLLAAVAALPCMAYAGIRVSNNSARSYAGAYNQVAAMREQEQMAAQQYVDIQTPSSDMVTDNTGRSVTLPVRVANAELAAKIANGDPTATIGMRTLEACSRIYPDGEFIWAAPSAGSGRGGASTCSAVVEMRALGAAPDGGDLLLARSNVAAGSSIKCNISEFPESDYNPEVAEFSFPADNPPTVNDVVHQMNDEQKKNAGIKIAAGAIIGGLGGNIAGKNDVGKDNLMGTDKGKIQGTAVGALLGAGIGAGNAYAGKVGGDIILSTGVNAAAGGVVGNIMASGDPVLRIEDCVIDGRKTSCLWGNVILNRPLSITTTVCPDATARDEKMVFYNVNSDTMLMCDCKMENCRTADLINVGLAAYSGKSVDDAEAEDRFTKILSSGSGFKYDRDTNKMQNSASGAEGWALVSRAGERDGAPIRAVVETPNLDKTFGAKKSDWYKWRNNNPRAKVYNRGTRGETSPLVLDGVEYSLNDFYPIMLDVDDGGIVDISNKARLKSTLTGAGIGGAMGGFVGYQGARNDIDARWISAMDEYRGSLTKIYCVTGKRFLSHYNDEIVIPSLSE